MYSSHRYPKGHVFFKEGAPGGSAHIIKSGQVEITVQRGGQEIIIDILGPGDIFGEIALLGGSIRVTTARAREQTDVINISRARLLSLLRNGDALLRHIILSLVQRLVLTSAKIHPENTNNVCVSVCRILDLLIDHESTSVDEKKNPLISYTTAIEKTRGILSIDATDCRLIFEKLEAINLIEIVDDPFSTDELIRLIDAERFLEKAERASKRLENALPNRLSQRPVYIDLFDFAESIGIERKMIYKKISEGEFPEEFLLFKRDEILKWAEKVGSSFFQERRRRISAEELVTLDDIRYVRNAILRTVLSQMDFYQICQLLTGASEAVRDKVLSNLSGRLKQVVEQELDLIEEVPPDEVEEATEDFLEEIRELMTADKQKREGESQGADDAPQNDGGEENS